MHCHVNIRPYQIDHVKTMKIMSQPLVNLGISLDLLDLTISVPSPGLLGQRFMTLECQLPVLAMQWIKRALVQAARKTAPPTGYRRKEECLSFLPMLDLRPVSVEKT